MSKLEHDFYPWTAMQPKQIRMYHYIQTGFHIGKIETIVTTISFYPSLYVIYMSSKSEK